MSDLKPCEKLETRLAALHTASLQMVQDISLPSLLQRIVILAVNQTQALYGLVGMVNENGDLERLVPAGMESGKIDPLKLSQGLNHTMGDLFRSGYSLILEDVKKDKRFRGLLEIYPDTKALLSVPIHVSNHVIGQILLMNSKDRRGFCGDDRQVVESLSAYAAVAISNAHLYERIYKKEQTLFRQTNYLSQINSLASTLAVSTQIDQILEDSLGRILEFLHIDTGQIFLRQEDSDVLKSMIYRGRDGNGIWKNEVYYFGGQVIGKTAQSNQVVIINRDDPEMDRKELVDDFFQVACFPLVSLRGTLGVLSIAIHDSKPLDEMDIRFLTAISSWMATIIDNLRLSIQQRRLAVHEERERIGMDLHDGIIQSIYGVGLTLEHARLLTKDNPDQVPDQINQAIKDLDHTIRDIRAYILDLRPRQFNEENLMQGIQRLANEFRVNSLLEISLQGSEEEVRDLPDSQALAMFHICQEALANITKHAHAQKVGISGWTSADRALLEITDDGCGFVMDKVKFALGHGLSNMQTRARNAGGDVEITSESGKGTTILVWVPYTRKKKIE